MSTVTSTPAANAYTSSQYNYLNGTYFPTPFHLQQQPLQPYIGPSPPPIAAPVVPAAASGVYSLPQYQQAQQLFQRVAQTITPEAIENVKAAIASSEIEQKAEAKKKAVPRKAAGQTWEDPTLADWPENDFRIFCGNLGNEVNDDVLSKAFARFPSFNMARVVRDKRTGKTKGYGFVSFSSPSDLVVALKEMNGMIRYLLKMTGPDWYWMITSNGSGKYVGNRPIQLRKSKWKDRIDYEVLVRRQNASPKKAKSPKKSILHK